MKKQSVLQITKLMQRLFQIVSASILSIAILTVFSFAKNRSITDHYYYNNAPYYLDLNYDNIYIGLKSIMSKEEFVNTSQSYMQFFNYDNFQADQKDQVIKFSHSLSESAIADLLNNLRSSGMFDFVSPVYSMPGGIGNSNTLIAAKDEIIVQYKINFSSTQIAVFEQEKDLTFVQNLDLRGGVTKVYKVSQNTFSIDAANEIFEIGMVNYSEPNFYMTNLLHYVPNDPLFSQQWALRNTGNNIPGGITGIAGCDMRLDSAWNITLGSNKVKIAVVDTGIDTLHEDIAGNILPNSQYNFITNSTNAFDDNGHGTGCSGIAAAIGNNSTGISGVAPNSKIN